MSPKKLQIKVSTRKGFCEFVSSWLYRLGVSKHRMLNKYVILKRAMLHAVLCENESTDNKVKCSYECIALYVFHVSKSVTWFRRKRARLHMAQRKSCNSLWSVLRVRVETNTQPRKSIHRVHDSTKAEWSSKCVLSVMWTVLKICWLNHWFDRHSQHACARFLSFELV